MKLRLAAPCLEGRLLFGGDLRTARRLLAEAGTLADAGRLAEAGRPTRADLELELSRERAAVERLTKAVESLKARLAEESGRTDLWWKRSGEYLAQVQGLRHELRLAGDALVAEARAAASRAAEIDRLRLDLARAEGKIVGAREALADDDGPDADHDDIPF